MKSPVLEAVTSTLRSPVKSRIDAIRSHQLQTITSEVDPSKAANDEELLHQIGYKEELRRQLGPFKIFTMAFGTMAILPAVSSVTALGLVSGPAGWIWSWFIASFFIMGIGISMSELASSMPTSAAWFYWTSHFAPKSSKIPLSYLVGMANALEMIGGTCGVNYGLAQEIAAAVNLSSNGSFIITNPKIYGIFAAATASQIIAVTLSNRKLGTLQFVSMILSNILVAVYLIALPIGTKINKGGFNEASFVFGSVQNLSTWTIGWDFVLSMMSAIWSVTGFDAPLYFSEEAKDASRSVPIGVLGSLAANTTISWFIVMVTCYCMDTEVINVLASSTGFPIAQVVYDSLGRNWAVAIMSIMAVCQWFMGAACINNLSRQVWAFSRDNGVPFSSWIKIVNKKLKVPIRSVLASGIMVQAVALLIFGGSIVANALFSLALAAGYVAWGLPIALRMIYGRETFHPGPFYTGIFSFFINWVSVFWSAFVVLMSFFPSVKYVSRDSMNYCVVITVGTFTLAMVYYYVYRYKFYFGPVSNINDDYDMVSIEGKANSTEDKIDTLILGEKPKNFDINV